MKRLLTASAAAAALLSASAAIAGPGCGGRSHDVTAETDAPAGAMSQPVEMADLQGGPTPAIDLLALLGGALPSELGPPSVTR